MRSRTLLLITTVFCLAAPASASAYFGHVIAPGESLSSVAATDGLSVDQLAAANGLSSSSQLTAGATLQIPPQDSSSAAAPSQSGSSSSSSSSEVSSSSASASDSSASSSSSSGGGYTVHYGDTLSAIAAQYGTTVDALASANGLDPAGILPAGVTLSISGSGSGSSSSAEPVSTSSSSSGASSGASDGSSASAAQPTPQTVSASDVGNVAADNGVSPSLAEAIGYQESGFNNNLVSSTGATGVMQIEPGTWSDINHTLVSPPPLSPTSAQDNIRGGVLLLHSLLDQTGGDPSLAAAGYYQGLQSVREHGLYSDTQQYVNNVMALRQRFGGP